MKVWITKYALTGGIIEAEIVRRQIVIDEHTKEQVMGYILCDATGRKYGVQFDDFEYSLESAIAKAEEMRQKKIASLKKQIEKLEGMKFE